MASPLLRASFCLLLAACPSSGGDDSGSTSATTTASATSSGSTSNAVPTTGDATTDVTTTVTTTDATTGAPELDPRVADCLRIAACEADGGQPIGVQVCLGHVLDVPWRWATTGPARLGLAAMDCKLAATDCDGVRACTPPAAGLAASCADNPASDLCVGDTWLFCDELGAPIAAMDCAAAGQTCRKDLWAGCGDEACTFGTTEATCEGDTLLECDASGNLLRIDCASQYNYVLVNGQEGEQVFSIAGETCGYDEMRGANGCIGTGAACGFFSQACDGATLETCAGGKLARRDCAAIDPPGQACGFVQSGAFAGAAACGFVEPACDLGGDEGCDGAVLSFCDLDHAGSVDCLAHGYTGCETGVLAGRTIAWCAP
jgi:hypothetical protein